ncbi:DUF4192 domain-containing protein [Georgenia daeguensis]|uniref:DUF4192 family protein n=1 Tax=Georgenia daeguensis TaxID=908355 RepID=A0ABP8EQ72_9MICO
MTTTETIRLSQPRDLIALIPYRLGFHPAESAVLVAVSVTPDGRKEVGLVARMDLADLASPLSGGEAAAVLAGHVAAQQPEDLHLVLYTKEEDDRVLHDVVDHLADALDEALWPLAPDLDPWRVGPRGWGHLDTCDCCPPAGHPLELLTASPAAAAMVTAGRAAAGDRSQLAVVRTRDGDALATAFAAAEAERERLREVRRACGGAPLVRGAAFGVPGARPARDQEPLRRWREQGARLWDAAVATGPGQRSRTAPEVLGRLLVVLGDKVVRDAVVAATMEAAEGRTGDYLDPGTVVRAFETEVAPDAEMVGRATALAQTVAAHAEPGGGGPALGALAYLAWWGNEGARADVVARQALQEEPGHRLAELVVAALEAGMPPAWVRTP